MSMICLTTWMDCWTPLPFRLLSSLLGLWIAWLVSGPHVLHLVIQMAGNAAILAIVNPRYAVLSFSLKLFERRVLGYAGYF